MVLRLAPVDAVIGLVAVTLVCAALTGPGTVNPRNVCADPTPVASADCVLSVGLIAVPSVQLVLATPLALVVDDVGFTDPPPSITDQEIVTPETGLLRLSRTSTESGTGSVCPTVSVWRSPPLMVIWLAPPTCAVTLKVTVVRPVALAVVV